MTIDRYVGIQISFPPALDEYFQVKRIKRGAEPIEKLRQDLRKAVEKPVRTARKRIRDLWVETSQTAPKKPDDASGGRQGPEEVAKKADDAMPVGKAGMAVTPAEEDTKFRQAATDAGIIEPIQQNKFVEPANTIPGTRWTWNSKGVGCWSSNT